MDKPDLELDPAKFEELQSAGLPDWVQGLEAIPSPPAEVFKRIRAEFRDLAPAFLGLMEMDSKTALKASTDVIDRVNYGIIFAAEHRDARFSDSLLRMLRFEEDLLDDFFGNYLTEGMHECIARICGHDLEGIKTLVLDLDADTYARWTALDSFKDLLADGIYSADELKEALRDVIARMDGDSLWDAVASVVIRLGWCEFETEILAALDAGFIGADMYGDRDAIIKAIHEEEVEKRDPDDVGLDAVLVFESWWEHERKMAAKIEAQGLFNQGEVPDDFALTDAGTFVRETEKVGRNEPCPCGSGKKFKKCCG